MEVAQERDPPGESGDGGGAAVFGIVKGGRAAKMVAPHTARTGCAPYHGRAAIAAACEKNVITYGLPQHLEPAGIRVFD